MSIRWAYILVVLSLLTPSVQADEFQSDWPKELQRIWIGPQYWSNPLQDWRISNGRLECTVTAPDRNVHLLTHQLDDSKGSFRISVRLGLLDKHTETADGRIGFRIGAKGRLNDYRDSVFKGKGLDAGITTQGELFIGETSSGFPASDQNEILGDIELRLTAEPAGKKYNLILTRHDMSTGRQTGQLGLEGVVADKLFGNIALVTNVRCWFSDWRLSGDKIKGSPEQTFGPVLFAQYTLSEGIMKMTAQMPPIGEQDSQVVRLETFENKSGQWKSLGYAGIDRLSRTAAFKVKNWTATEDVKYRLVYTMPEVDGRSKNTYYNGTVRYEPTDQETIVIAAFTGNKDFAFPNTDIVKNVTAHDPDVSFFSGDQIYELNGGYGFVREPLQIACLDYLRKWYLFGWAFRDLLRDRPSISIPDDHDVYQSNLWGAAGRKIDKIDKGGYIMPSQFVNMVQRTQTSHLPDPYDPAVVQQGIEVYYTVMNYGRISFAIIEDRKFKSGPKGLVPKTTGGRADHVIDLNFDPETADVPEAKLLDGRQLDFLENWVADWQNSDMKVVLSQTIFANVANLHGPDKIRLVADYDSNGWPQTGRNKALAEMRKGFAFHIAGDQHLATVVHHGIDSWNDAGYSFCVPSIAAGYPRSWLPLGQGKNRKADMPDYTGEFIDGFGNYITVRAAANPIKTMAKADTIADLRAKASGYGIVRLNKKDQTITMECWPLDVDPTEATAKQFPGWPMTINIQDNYGRKAKAYLPTFKVSGIDKPVFQIIDEANGEIVYTIRVSESSFAPKVFMDGLYSVIIGEPGTKQLKTLMNISSLKANETRIIEVKL